MSREWWKYKRNEKAILKSHTTSHTYIPTITKTQKSYCSRKGKGDNNKGQNEKVA